MCCRHPRSIRPSASRSNHRRVVPLKTGVDLTKRSSDFSSPQQSRHGATQSHSIFPRYPIIDQTTGEDSDCPDLIHLHRFNSFSDAAVTFRFSSDLSESTSPRLGSRIFPLYNSGSLFVTPGSRRQPRRSLQATLNSRYSYQALDQAKALTLRAPAAKVVFTF